VKKTFALSLLVLLLGCTQTIENPEPDLTSEGIPLVIAGYTNCDINPDYPAIVDQDLIIIESQLIFSSISDEINCGLMINDTCLFDELTHEPISFHNLKLSDKLIVKGYYGAGLLPGGLFREEQSVQAFFVVNITDWVSVCCDFQEARDCFWHKPS